MIVNYLDPRTLSLLRNGTGMFLSSMPAGMGPLMIEAGMGAIPMEAMMVIRHD